MNATPLAAARKCFAMARAAVDNTEDESRRHENTSMTNVER
jgi:hypothetical protein